MAIPIKKISNREENKNFDYLYFARAYLLLAYLGTEKLIDNMSVENGEYENPLIRSADDYLVPDFVFRCNYLIAPVLYNLKHSIEIFIKSSALFLNLSDNDFQTKHDLRLLFSKIRTELNTRSNFKKEGDEVPRKIKVLENLVTKYHQNNVLKNKIADNFTMIDTMNDIFRYPDNKAKIDLNFFNIFIGFSERDIKEIQEDIKSFNELFYDIGKKILEDKHGDWYRVYESDYG